MKKFALVFDESKEIVSIPKEQAAKLDKFLKSEKIKIASWSEFLMKLMEDKHTWSLFSQTISPT